MPHVFDGIGTWYYGKRNLLHHFDVCQECGKESMHASYDTTLYFVFVYIPVMPLGRAGFSTNAPVAAGTES